MAIRCPECSTPAVAGHRFCGRCGALVAPSASAAPAGPAPDVPVASESATPAASTVEVAVGDGDGDPAPRRRWPRTGPGIMATLAVVIALVGLGRVTVTTGAGFAGAPAAEPLVDGGANWSSTVVPDLTGEVAWTGTGAPRESVLGPLPLAAPLVLPDRLVTAVPGAVVVHDRASGAIRRIDVPTTGSTSARALPDGTVVVLGAEDAWFLGRDGVVARAGQHDLADVTPVVVDDAVVVQTNLGGLVRLALVGGAVEATSLRGVTASAEGEAVPRFELGVHAVDDEALWVGSRDRETDQAGLWRLDRQTLEPLLRLSLGTVDLPTVVSAQDTSVVVAHDDLALRLLSDGTTDWILRPGDDAEVLGFDDGRVLVRFATGRNVIEVARGQVVAGATTVLLEGPRSQVAGGEVLMNDRDQLQGLRVFDATVARRLEGRPLSVAGQDDGTVAWVTLGAGGEVVLRIQPTPDRSRAASLDAVDLPLPIDRGCAVAPAGDRIVWHDGEDLREVQVRSGEVTSRLTAGSSAGSTVVVARSGQELATHVVDTRGVVRRYSRGLDDMDVLTIGNDPVLGIATDEDLVVVAGGTGRVAVVGASDGYIRGMGPDGATRWLVRIRGAVASPPSAAAGLAAIRQSDGGIALVRDGVFVGDVDADARALDSPLVDARGALLRDGRDVAAVFPAGETAWTTAGVAQLPGLASDGDVVVSRRVEAVVGLDRQTGSVLWEAPMTDGEGRPTTPLSTPVIADDRVLVAVHDALVVLDVGTGAELDRHVADVTWTGPVVATSTGIVGCTASGALQLVG